MPTAASPCSCPAFRGWSRAPCGSGAKTGWRCVEGPREAVEEGDEADYAACVLGLRDYVENNRFPGVVLGLSGGVDSALCAAMAVERWGLSASTRSCCLIATPRRIASRRRGLRRGARAPLRHRADRRAGRGGRARAGADVRRAGARHHGREHPEPHARPHPDGDLQQDRRDGGDDRQQVGNVGRLRDALRRHERRLQSDQGPLQDGGLPPVGLAQPLEARSARSGRTATSSRANIIAKPPSAELRENQKDEDSLPPYPVLDGILHGLVEKEMRVADIVAAGYDLETVSSVERMLYLAEYKRRQSAPGVKVGPKNFGRDRRYPIVNRFRDPGRRRSAGRLDRAARLRRGRASGSRNRGARSDPLSPSPSPPLLPHPPNRSIFPGQRRAPKKPINDTALTLPDEIDRCQAPSPPPPRPPNPDPDPHPPKPPLISFCKQEKAVARLFPPGKRAMNDRQRE